MAKKRARRSTATKQADENKNTITLTDHGEIEIEIKGGKHDGMTRQCDILELKIAAEPVEQKHHPGEGKRFVPTFRFFKELAAAYVSDGILPVCTPRMAAELWGEVWRIWNNAKKNS